MPPSSEPDALMFVTAWLPTPEMSRMTAFLRCPRSAAWPTCYCTYRISSEVAVWYLENGPRRSRGPFSRYQTSHRWRFRHNAPGLLETVDQLLRTKVGRKLLNQDKPSRLANYALQQHKAKSARLAASEFSFLLAVSGRSRWVRAVEQAWDENSETSASNGRAW